MSSSLAGLVEKCRWVVQQLDVATRLVAASSDDYQKRVVSKSTVLRVENSLQLLPRCKNRLAAVGADVREAEVCLSRLRRDYADVLQRTRHALTAHRQDLDLDELLDAWNAVDALSTTVLADDAIAAYEALARISSAVPALRRSTVLDSAAVRDAWGLRVRGDDVVLSMDSLALSRPDGMGFIPVTDVQDRATQIVSTLRIYAEIARLASLPGDSSTAVLLECLAVVEVLSGLELLLDAHTFSRQSKRPKSLQRALLEAGQYTDALSTLARFERRLDVTAVDALRDVRDHIAAHVDEKQPLATSLSELRALPIDYIEATAAFIERALRATLAHDLVLSKLLAVEGAATLSGVRRARDIGRVPFDM